LRIFYLPISGQAIVMETQRNKVCGADIHKKFLVATIISRDGIKMTKRFGMTLEDLLEFKSWVVENQCEQVAVESTGVYWIPIHAVLEDAVDLIVAPMHTKSNTYQEERVTLSTQNGLLNFVLTA
jgi:hypothetical protein